MRKKHKSKAIYWHTLYYITLEHNRTLKRQVNSFKEQIAEEHQENNRLRMQILLLEKEINKHDKKTV